MRRWSSATTTAGGVHEGMKAGALYLATDDVDAAFTVKDTEGNLWTVGDYRGATRA